MRKVIALMHLSLDGFAAGPNGEMDWILLDDELFQDVDKLTASVDTALYGRVTYHMMEGYWPTVLDDPNASPHDLHHARWVQAVQKIVFSRTLDKVEWNNARVVKDHIAEEMARLKQQPGQDMMIFGSPRLTHTFMELGLIDEYRLTINPVLLGKGMPYFQNIQAQTNLKLAALKTYKNGVIAAHYQRGS